MLEGQIGEENLGEFARLQVETARRDPRLERGRGAMVADFWAAIEEAERVRPLGVLGLHELQHALEREKDRSGVSREDEELPRELVPALQAAWERAELARSEIANGHPHLNEQALLSMNSALDAFVDEFVPAMRAVRVKAVTEAAFRRAEEQLPEAAQQLSPEALEHLRAAARAVFSEEMLPEIKWLGGSGTKRYEALLEQVGLGAPGDRPIPQDLDQALAELSALRDVLVHRAGRVDPRALKKAPSLSYDDGELVRISDEDYRRYSAAVRCYAREITFRSVRHWPEARDEKDGPELDKWRGYYRIGA